METNPSVLVHPESPRNSARVVHICFLIQHPFHFNNADEFGDIKREFPLQHFVLQASSSKVRLILPW